MTYGWEFSNTPAGRVLKAIQVRGKASIKDVAADLGVTTSAVRLYLAQLEARGVIQTEQVREGVGRPHYIYSLTPDGYDFFAKDYGDLARLLLEEVAKTQGPDALRNVLSRVGDRMADLYRDRIAGHDLSERVRAWAELLDQRGVSVEIERTGDGYVVREYGCRYRNVAVENRAVCDMERQVMARLLESGVRLTQCVLDGSHGCQFAILQN